MTDALAPRGPDVGNEWASRHVCFGHRRLVIIDPAGGSQPMIRSRDGAEYVLVYNGELYNTEEVRKELVARGRPFEAYSDTEVVLQAYIEWGEDCVRHLEGIFAFAVCDEARQCVFFARDRLGVKPLFFAEVDGDIVFASELKAVVRHPAVPPVLDADGVAHVLLLGPSRKPGHGVFRNVRELEAGHVMRFDRKGRTERAYWTLESRPHTDDVETTVRRARELLFGAAKRQLVSDVPLCNMLSGGLDSSGLTGVTATEYATGAKAPLHTWSVQHVDAERHFAATDAERDQDAPWAKRVAEHYRTAHHVVEIESHDLADALAPAMVARDMPGIPDLDAGLLLFCRGIRASGAKVALSGEGADEVFGGYRWFFRDDLLSRRCFPWLPAQERRVELVSPALRGSIDVRYAENLYESALREVPPLPGEAGPDARIREMFYLNLVYWLPVLLDRKDRMSMATGLEVRVPFLDHHLVEYMWNVPWSTKSMGREKGLLRRVFESLLPEDVLARTKKPFPRTQHPAYDTLVRGRLRAALDDRSSPMHALIDTAAARSLLEQPDRGVWYGGMNRDPQLVAYLLQLDAWMRHYRVEIRV